MVRLAQEASAKVIAVDEFPYQRAESMAVHLSAESPEESMEEIAEAEPVQQQEQGS